MIPQHQFNLSRARISLQLCLLGLGVGLLASLAIILFQLTVNGLQAIFAVKDGDFTQLGHTMRVALPLVGALVIFFIVMGTQDAYRRMGIAYVIHRVKMHYGRMPIVSNLGQFFHAVVALVCGFSVGKEGPAIHIGAGVATMLAERWKLPDNTVRILSACGIAAGIAAIFNTPLAGVIFVLEVVLREYKTHYFLPILIAAMTGSVVYRSVFGDVHLYANLELALVPMTQYPTLVLFGLVVGIVAALFSHSLLFTTRHASRLPLWARFAIAGGLTALIASQVPQVMGSEGAVVKLAHDAEAGLLLLGTLLLAKSFATIAAIGFGIPGGLIGPLYGIGALLGGILTFILTPLLPELQHFQGLYAAIGMTAMMGVCLNAPMASLLALVELTENATLILPFLLVTLPAYLLAHQGLGARAIFLRQLDIMGLEYRQPPLEQALQKTGVLAIMSPSLVMARPNQSDEELMELLSSAEANRLLQRGPEGMEMVTLHADFTEEQNTALRREVLEGVPHTATMAEVYQLLESRRSGAVYVYHGEPDTAVGLITWPMLYRHIRSGEV